MLFLSTPSARRATRCQRFGRCCWHDFYPRPPRGGRLATHQYCNDAEPFLSTPSARRATHGGLFRNVAGYISIHALREEGDPAEKQRQLYQHISIHALREEGDYRQTTTHGTTASFLSTPSARRATLLFLQQSTDLVHFYPRPPRGGRRTKVLFYKPIYTFLSTPSARRATSQNSKTS